MRKSFLKLLITLIIFGLTVSNLFSKDIYSSKKRLKQASAIDTISWSDIESPDITSVVGLLKPTIQGSRQTPKIKLGLSGFMSQYGDSYIRRELPGEKVGLSGALITHGGRGRNEAIVIYNPDGAPTGVVTRKEATEDPETARNAIEAACRITTGEHVKEELSFSMRTGDQSTKNGKQSIEEISYRIGEIISPSPVPFSFDVDKDGMVDWIRRDTNGKTWYKLSSGKSLEGSLSGNKSVVRHLQPIVYCNRRGNQQRPS